MKLVFIASNHCDETPYTTPEIIAEAIPCDCYVIEDYLKEHYRDFRMRATCPTSIYCEPYNPNHLNEVQTMLLFERANESEQVVAARDRFALRFNTINDKLNARRMQRKLFLAARQERTDLMRTLGIKTILHGQYAELAFFSAFGECASAVRHKSCVPARAHTMDYLSADDLTSLTKAQEVITKHLRNGDSYEQIRALVTKKSADDKVVSMVRSIPDADISTLVWKYVADNIRQYL